MLRAHAFGDLTAHEPVGGLIGEGCGGGLQQRGADIAAFTRAFALQEREQQCLLQLVGKQQVHQGDRHLRGRAVRLAVEVGESAFGLDDGVEAGARILGSVCRDLRIDHLGIEVSQACIVQGELLVISRLEALDHDVTASHEVMDEFAAALRREVHRDGFLAPVGAGEIGRHVGVRRLRGELPTTRRISVGARILHFDHPRAELGEKHAGHRTRQDIGELQHHEVRQRVAIHLTVLLTVRLIGHGEMRYQ